MSVEVLNGTIDIGDRVAFAARVGNLAQIRVGEVVGFVTKEAPYGKGTITRIKIRVTLQSDHVRFGNKHGASPHVDRIAGVEIAERVVRL